MSISNLHHRSLLVSAGLLLFGGGWQESLSKALVSPNTDHIGISSSLLRRWIAGSRPIPPWVWPQLSKALRTKLVSVEECLEDLNEVVQRTERPLPDRGFESAA